MNYKKGDRLYKMGIEGAYRHFAGGS
jgi:hypothetical protein